MHKNILTADNSPTKKIMTLCFVSANSQILLGFKKRGFGAGKWNGFGGKVGPRETILEAAHRELMEECGIIALDFEQRAVLKFRFQNSPDEIEAHVFEVKNFKGEPIETEEMKPQWFYANEIPFDKMWADDRFWFPYFLEHKNFEGDFLFKDESHLLDYKITEITK
jgi:8-oxo-dGTP diphosphatase/2-hydroxy-dATP diphosphatase